MELLCIDVRVVGTFAAGASLQGRSAVIEGFVWSALFHEVVRADWSAFLHCMCRSRCAA